MSKIVLWSLAVIITSSLGGSAYYFFSADSKKIGTVNNCTFEVKTCSDGTSVTRVGKSCDFAKCPNEISGPPPVVEETLKELPLSTSTVATSTLVTTTKIVEKPVAKKVTPTIDVQPKKPSTIAIATTYVASLFGKTGAALGSAVSAVQEAISNVGNQQNNTTTSPKNMVTDKYIVKDGSIVTSDNKIIYTIPENIIQSLGTTTVGWTNTPINVVPVGVVAPILNAIPIKDLPGKYYLSENSFGNIENCEFSNKIFILDSVSNQVTLMYEENNETLSRDDPRACNSEIFLLATEESKLILKYHTLNTNTLCDSSWSEPDKTWNLDVTNLSAGMKRYFIPDDLRLSAETQEESCRAKL